MRIAVTGANGYVGAALCQYLLDQGIDVTALVRQSSLPQPPSQYSHLQHSHLQSSHLQYVPVDYSEPQTLIDALDGADAVIHLIAKTHAKDVMSELDEYRAINVTISQAVAKAAIAAKVKRLVFLSSIKVNGESTCEAPFRHSDQPAPTTAYGISKLEAEKALSSLCTSHLELVILRPPLVYSSDAKGNISTLKKAIQQGLPLPLGNLHNKRDIVDLNLLCEYLYKSCITQEAAGKTFLISNGAALSTTQLVKRIGRDIDRKPRLLPIPDTLLKRVGKLLRKQEQIDKLCGNLELDDTPARSCLQPARLPQSNSQASHPQSNDQHS